HIAPVCYVFPLSVLRDPPCKTHVSTLSLHDALPISIVSIEKLEALSSKQRQAFFEALGRLLVGTGRVVLQSMVATETMTKAGRRSEEHTSELQSRFDLVCRLLPDEKM